MEAIAAFLTAKMHDLTAREHPLEGTSGGYVSSADRIFLEVALWVTIVACHSIRRVPGEERSIPSVLSSSPYSLPLNIARLCTGQFQGGSSLGLVGPCLSVPTPSSTRNLI